jgi:hypothetical protein
VTLITPHDAERIESGTLRWQEVKAAYAGPNTSWDTLRFLQDGSPPPQRPYYRFSPSDPTPRVVEIGRTAREPQPCCEPLTRRERWMIGLPTALGLVLWAYGLYQIWRWLA